MSFITTATVFAVGFIAMTPIGPVSTICIRRSLLYGRRAGIAAGAGNAVALATYATLGVSGSVLLPRFFSAYTNVWHFAISSLLIVAAIVLWRARPLIPAAVTADRGAITGGFGATLLVALANPADIVLFAAIFTALGIAVNSALDQLIFCITIFTGGLGYWIIVAAALNRWRSGLTTGRIVWLNRASSMLMVVAAIASVTSVIHPRVS